MPARPNVPQVVKVVLQHLLHEDADVVDILHWLYTGAAPTQAQLITWAASIAAKWLSDLAPLTHPDCKLIAVGAEDLSSSTAAVGAWNGSNAGTRTGTYLAAGSPPCVSLHISRRYRGGHPRCYFPAFTQSDTNDAQTWTTASMIALATAFSTFLNDVSAAWPVGGATAGPVNVSYYHGFTNVTNPITGRTRPVPTLRGTPLVDTITGLSINPHIASQRRRNQTP